MTTDRHARPSSRRRNAAAVVALAAAVAASSHAVAAAAASASSGAGSQGAAPAFVRPVIEKGPLAAARGSGVPHHRPRLATRMMAAEGSEGKRSGGGLGRSLRRALGGVLAAVGLGSAPLRKETLELLQYGSQEAREQMVTAQSIPERLGLAWQGLSDGLAAAFEGLPEGNDYETALGKVATQAGVYMHGVYDSATAAAAQSLQAALGVVRAAGIDPDATAAAAQEMGAEWAAALDGRVEASAQFLGDLLGEAAGKVPAVGLGGGPDAASSQELVRSLATFLKQAAVNPATRLQTEEALGALIGGGIALAAAKSLLGPAIDGAWSQTSLTGPDGRPMSEYDAATVDAYYKARPARVLSRLVSALSDSSSFLGGLLLDYVRGKDVSAANAPLRAKQLTSLITELGPVFIKVGQLISVRPDIVSPAYLKELQQLQDQVKAFSSTEAQAIIAANLPKGTTLRDVYEDPDRDFREPVAAASLGQVYKAVLKDSGIVVAVKVQRPSMLENITLDLFTVNLVMGLGRRFGSPRIRRQCKSFMDVLDQWGGRFIQELDYAKEAQNSRTFARAMAGNPLVSENIIVPQVFDDISTRYVLVTEWIEGRKISAFRKEDPKDRERLEQIVAVLLNSYLIQLLETGFLHADPHAGNFLITNDGRLCILDHGLITEIEEDQRIALVQYVAHLLAKDYDATVDDLVLLGFLPKEIGEDASKRNIVAPVLAAVLEQLANGGGAKAAKRIKVEDIGDEVKALSKKYPLRIPPWFGLIVRTFSALEGLGLGLDGDYSITNQCFPYLSRRLLTDDDPRIRAALKSFLYGRDEQLKVQRVNDMLAGYRNFTTAFDSFQGVAALPGTAAAANQGIPAPALATTAAAGGRTAVLKYDRATMEALQILFHKDGNFVQELLVDEMVRMTDAAVKEATGLLARRAKATPLALTGFFRQPPAQLLPAPLRNAVLLPFFPLIAFLGLFAAMAERAESLSQLTEEDRESLKTLRLLLSLVTQRGEEALQLQQGQQQGQQQQARLPFPFPPFPIPVPSFGGSARRAPGPFPFPPFPFPLPSSSGGGNDPFLTTALDLSAGVMQVLPEVAPGMAQIGRRFLTQLTGRVLARLADELERSSSSSAAASDNTSTTLF